MLMGHKNFNFFLNPPVPALPRPSPTERPRRCHNFSAPPAPIFKKFTALPSARVRIELPPRRTQHPPPPPICSCGVCVEAAAAAARLSVCGRAVRRLGGRVPLTVRDEIGCAHGGAQGTDSAAQLEFCDNCCCQQSQFSGRSHSVASLSLSPRREF